MLSQDACCVDDSDTQVMERVCVKEGEESERTAKFNIRVSTGFGGERVTPTISTLLDSVIVCCRHDLLCMN